MSTPSSDPAGRFDVDAFYRGDKPPEDVPAVCTVPWDTKAPKAHVIGCGLGDNAIYLPSAAEHTPAPISVNRLIFRCPAAASSAYRPPSPVLLSTPRRFREQIIPYREMRQS